MCDKWRSLVDASGKSSTVIEAANYISLATLDALGIGEFGFINDRTVITKAHALIVAFDYEVPRSICLP